MSVFYMTLPGQFKNQVLKALTITLYTVQDMFL